MLNLNLNKKINEMTVGELMSIIDNFLDKKFENIDKKFENLNKKFDYMESEIKTIKLTQNYIRETTNIGLEKPLDSISLASFLADEQEENSFFKLFR